MIFNTEEIFSVTIEVPHQASSQPSDKGGGILFLRFWNFSGFENWEFTVAVCLGETSIFKIIMIDDVTLWSELESSC